MGRRVNQERRQTFSNSLPRQTGNQIIKQPLQVCQEAQGRLHDARYTARFDRRMLHKAVKYLLFPVLMGAAVLFVVLIIPCICLIITCTTLWHFCEKLNDIIET